MYRRAFTLIEVLVSVAIISLLIALIIPNIDRSLSKNNIANDAQLFKAKLEEVRLVSGSQQTDDVVAIVLSSSQYGKRYYGAIIHSGRNNFYSLVNIYYSACAPGNAINASFSGNTSSPCIIERVKLSPGVEIVSAENHLMVFEPPQQRLYSFKLVNGIWTLSDPVFRNPLFQLVYQDKVASVEVSDYTGKVTTRFINND